MELARRAYQVNMSCTKRLFEFSRILVVLVLISRKKSGDEDVFGLVKEGEKGLINAINFYKAKGQDIKSEVDCFLRFAVKYINAHMDLFEIGCSIKKRIYSVPEVEFSDEVWDAFRYIAFERVGRGEKFETSFVKLLNNNSRAKSIIKVNNKKLA